MSYKAGLGIADDIYASSDLVGGRRHRRSSSFPYGEPRWSSSALRERSSRDYYGKRPLTERIADALMPSSSKYKYGTYGDYDDRWRSRSSLGDYKRPSYYDRYYPSTSSRYRYSTSRHLRKRSSGHYDDDLYGTGDYPSYHARRRSSELVDPKDSRYYSYTYNTEVEPRRSHVYGYTGRRTYHNPLLPNTIRPHARKYFHPKRVEIEGYSSDSSSSSSSSSSSDDDDKRRSSRYYYNKDGVLTRRYTGLGHRRGAEVRRAYSTAVAKYNADDLAKDYKGKLRVSAYPYFGTVNDTNTRVSAHPYYTYGDGYTTKHMRASSDGPWSITTVQHVYRKPPNALVERPGYYEKTYYEKPGGAYYEKGDGYYERPGKYFQKDEYYEDKRIGY